MDAPGLDVLRWADWTSTPRSLVVCILTDTDRLHRRVNSAAVALAMAGFKTIGLNAFNSITIPNDCVEKLFH